ncbi:hypothetical protein [Halofilum ochraceum]|uniref:hypothetical protein n=1 Tax=Halofilum ochraceum TaxID=1611323 RepID=UPI001FE1DC99|nr:hypothetical protein [Halofilum ochraceum]
MFFRPILATAVCLLLLAGCGGEPTATQLELVDLARFSEQYDGERVSTTGHVRSHSDPEHYWLEDDNLNRVAVHPDSAVESLVGQRVRVVGGFRFSRESGRAIEADTVEVLP